MRPFVPIAQYFPNSIAAFSSKRVSRDWHFKVNGSRRKEDQEWRQRRKERDAGEETTYRGRNPLKKSRCWGFGKIHELFSLVLLSGGRTQATRIN